MAPCEALLHVLLGLEALHKLDDLKVGHIDLRVLGGIEILLGIQNALLEQILVNLHPILLGDQHPACHERATTRCVCKASSRYAESSGGQWCRCRRQLRRSTKRNAQDEETCFL